jgi:EmrB/QacA subfamily drug resistance transporter
LRRTILQSAGYKWWVFGAVGLGTFTSVVDHGSLNVALPTIASHFDTDLPTVQWVVVGYALTISALLLPMGRLSDIVGRKPVYVAGFALFVTGAVLAGLSTHMVTLILSRVLQGCGAAMTQGTGMAIVTSAFSREERGKALGSHLSVVGSGSITGPALGGVLVSNLGWQWVFFVNAAAALAAIAVAVVVLDRTRFVQRDRRDSFDWPGAALSTGVLVSFLSGMTSGPRMGWESPAVVLGLSGAAVLLAAFIWWELRAHNPMLDLRWFRVRLFSMGVSAGFIGFMGSSSLLFLMPFYLQTVAGYSPAKVGLIMMPSALSFIILGPLSGRLSDRYGFRRFNIAGLMLISGSLFLLSRVTETTPLPVVMLGMVLNSSGMGMFNSPNNSSILSTVELSSYGVVSALLNLVRNAANVTSIAISTAIVTSTMASMGQPASLDAVADAPHAFVSGVRTALLALGCVVLVGVVASFLKGGRPREAPDHPVPAPQLGKAPGAGDG